MIKMNNQCLDLNRFAGFDILKFISAFLIICIHSPFPGVIGEYFTALTRIAVPIFLMITGFYYSDAVSRGTTIKQIKKILILVLKANLLYWVWMVLYLAVSGGGLISWIEDTFTWKNAINFLVFNVSPFNGHLWYLGAVLYVLLIVEVFRKTGRYCKHLISVLTPVLLIGDLVLGKYSILLWGHEFPYILVRNWLFVGLPYFSIGVLLREKFSMKHLSVSWLLSLTVLFSTTTFAERFLLVSMEANATRDHYVSTTFLAVAVFLLFLRLYQERQLGRVESWMAIVGRKYSTWIYIIHPIFITVLAVFMKKAGLYGAYRYVAPIIVYIVSIFFVAAIGRMKRSVKLRR